jgi:TRAP-type C4-dicarboxylate transport system substrate-binding protein
MAIFMSGATICYAKEAGKPIVLKFGSWTNPKGGFGKTKNWYLTEVEKRTQGRVKFERYWAGSLAPAKELLDALEAGIADVATIMPAYYPGKLPLGTVASVPGVWEDSYEAGMAYHDLYKEMAPLQKELAKYNSRFLSPVIISQYHISSVARVAALADLKGVKIRAAGHQATLMKALGAVPVGMTAPEIYTALERGTIDAVCFSPAAITVYGLHTVLKYYWAVPTGGQGIFLAINQDVWNRLPADIQKIMEEVALEHPKANQRIYQIEGNMASLEKMKAAGVEIIQASPEVKMQVTKVAKDVIGDKWVEEQEAKGRPGRQVMDRFAALVKKYEAVSPFK